MSRTSIREAVRQLQTLGLIETTSGRGMRVAVLRSDDVRHIYEVRDALEPAATELFVLRASDPEVADLTECVAAPNADLETRLKAIHSFDRLLLAGARNPVLQESVELLHARIHALRRLSLTIPGRRAASAQEYFDLVSAIQDRNPTRAVAASHRHVRAAAQAALAAVATLEQLAT